MTLPGETIGTGAPYSGYCPDCKKPMPIQVCKSAAGYYIGTFCNSCGPYSRESEYFSTREEAQMYLHQFKGENQ